MRFVSQFMQKIRSRDTFPSLFEQFHTLLNREIPRPSLYTKTLHFTSNRFYVLRSIKHRIHIRSKVSVEWINSE